MARGSPFPRLTALPGQRLLGKRRCISLRRARKVLAVHPSPSQTRKTDFHRTTATRALSLRRGGMRIDQRGPRMASVASLGDRQGGSRRRAEPSLHSPVTAHDTTSGPVESTENFASTCPSPYRRSFGQIPGWRPFARCSAARDASSRGARRGRKRSAPAMLAAVASIRFVGAVSSPLAEPLPMGYPRQAPRGVIVDLTPSFHLSVTNRCQTCRHLLDKRPESSCACLSRSIIAIGDFALSRRGLAWTTKTCWT
jgi:hypothetical protein